jgi:hypothetical protein
VDEGLCIRIWTRDTIPERFAHLARLADDGEIENTVFVAHVPAAMLADRTYRACNGESGTDGWMREGELGGGCSGPMPWTPCPTQMATAYSSSAVGCSSERPA